MINFSLIFGIVQAFASIIPILLSLFGTLSAFFTCVFNPFLPWLTQRHR